MDGMDLRLACYRDSACMVQQCKMHVIMAMLACGPIKLYSYPTSERQAA